MARRKKRKTPMKRVYGKRRSSVGAIDTQGILGTVLGAVGARLIDKVIPDTLDKKIVAGGKIVLGALLPSFVKSGSMKTMLQGVGNGFVAVGSLDLVEELGVISGFGEASDDELAVALEGIEDVEFEDVSDQMNENVLGEDVLGADDLDVVNGNTDLDVVNGMNEDGEEDDMDMD